MKKIPLFAAAIVILSCIGCGAEPECSIGQRICVNNVSKTCYEGHWRSVECANAAPVCDETYGCIPIPQTCGNEIVEGTEECDGANLDGKTCNDMFSGLVGRLACSECQFDTSGCHAPGCAENTQRCGETGVETCQDGQWKQTKACQNNERCDHIEAKCVPYLPCDEPGVSCVENILSICAGGQLMETVCNEGQVCSVINAKCEPKVCDEGAQRCDGKVAQVCIQNGWYNAMDCDKSELICDNTTGLCAQTCQDGAETCSADFTAVVSCENGVQRIKECGAQKRCAISESGNPECQTWACDEGIECKGANPNSTIKMIKVCENNVLLKSEICKESDGFVCSVEKAACVPLVCKAGDVECQIVEGVSHQAICENNAWSLTPCEGDTVCTMDIEGDGSLSCGEKVCEEGYACQDQQSIFCWNNNVANRTPCENGCDETTGRCQ